MRALSIQQPWADLILTGGKDVENRSWWPPKWMIGQRFYVHAGKTVDWDAPGEWRTESERLGAILGSVKLVAAVSESDSEWFAGPVGFVLRDPIVFARPTPCRGRLGFFKPEVKVDER